MSSEEEIFHLMNQTVGSDTTTSPPVGEWSTAEEGALVPGEHLLSHPPTRAAVAEIRASAAGPSPPGDRSGSVDVVNGLLDPSQCEALVKRTEEAIERKCSADPSLCGPLGFDAKIEITASELSTLIGEETATKFLACCRADSNTFVKAPMVMLRRSAAVEGKPRVIAWHRDNALSVVSVSLNTGYEGGQIFFAQPEGIVAPPRPLGAAIVHDQATVHGVSSLTAGVRYNLFAILYAESLDMEEEAVF